MLDFFSNKYELHVLNAFAFFFLNYAAVHISSFFNRFQKQLRGRCGRDRMVVGITTICAISCEFEPRSWRGVLDRTLCDKNCQ